MEAFFEKLRSKTKGEAHHQQVTSNLQRHGTSIKYNRSAPSSAASSASPGAPLSSDSSRSYTSSSWEPMLTPEGQEAFGSTHDLSSRFASALSVISPRVEPQVNRQSLRAILSPREDETMRNPSKHRQAQDSGAAGRSYNTSPSMAYRQRLSAADAKTSVFSSKLTGLDSKGSSEGSETPGSQVVSKIPPLQAALSSRRWKGPSRLQEILSLKGRGDHGSKHQNSSNKQAAGNKKSRLGEKTEPRAQQKDSSTSAPQQQSWNDIKKSITSGKRRLQTQPLPPLQQFDVQNVLSHSAPGCRPSTVCGTPKNSAPASPAVSPPPPEVEVKANTREVDDNTIDELHVFSNGQMGSAGSQVSSVAPTGRRCRVESCTSMARSKRLCTAHGGGKKCSSPGCANIAQSRGLCRSHGGGSRCKMDGCVRSAQSRGLCRTHGGGQICRTPGCSSSVVSGGLCRAHGGGKICVEPSCGNVAQSLGRCRTHAGKCPAEIETPSSPGDYMDDDGEDERIQNQASSTESANVSAPSTSTPCPPMTGPTLLMGCQGFANAAATPLSGLFGSGAAIDMTFLTSIPAQSSMDFSPSPFQQNTVPNPNLSSISDASVLANPSMSNVSRIASATAQARTWVPSPGSVASRSLSSPTGRSVSNAEFFTGESGINTYAASSNISAADSAMRSMIFSLGTQIGTNGSIIPLASQLVRSGDSGAPSLSDNWTFLRNPFVANLQHMQPTSMPLVTNLSPGLDASFLRSLNESQQVSPVTFQSYSSPAEQLSSITPAAPLVSAPLVSAPSTSSVRYYACQVAGCTNTVRSKGLCKSHGGNRRCQIEGCKSSAQSRNLCRAHGGGSRCTISGCTSSAQSGGLCRTHGGGKVCQFQGCLRSARSGGRCISHGGGKRCRVVGCTRSVQSRGVCKAHGANTPAGPTAADMRADAEPGSSTPAPNAFNPQSAVGSFSNRNDEITDEMVETDGHSSPGSRSAYEGTHTGTAAMDVVSPIASQAVFTRRAMGPAQLTTTLPSTSIEVGTASQGMDLTLQTAPATTLAAGRGPDVVAMETRRENNEEQSNRETQQIRSQQAAQAVAGGIGEQQQSQSPPAGEDDDEASQDRMAILCSVAHAA